MQIALTSLFHLIHFSTLEPEPEIDPCPSGFEHHSTTAPPLHHSDFCIVPNPFLSLLSQLTLWLFKGLGALAKAERLSFFRLCLMSKFHFTIIMSCVQSTLRNFGTFGQIRHSGKLRSRRCVILNFLPESDSKFLLFPG